MNETSGFLAAPEGRIAWRRIEGAGPQLVWLGGFNSDMTGTKAQALSDWATRAGRAFLRFDYFGHGASDGVFRDGTISRWRADALTVIDELTEGPLVLVGSSMGGWIACLAALSRPERVQSMVLLAPAADFTEKLMKPAFPQDVLREITETGSWTRPSPYGDEGYPITRALLEDGARWSILDAPVAIHCPVQIVQGGADEDVPWRHALSLALAIEGDQVVFTLVKDGDHRLSREADIDRLIMTVETVLTAP
jgi:pimeloyl-ACP methyl ester carboxylesterase